MTMMAVGRDGAPMMAVGRDGALMMAVGRDGAPTMAVRCPTGDNASGDHIVFNLQQRSFSSFSLHQKTTDAFTNLVTLGAKSKLMSLMRKSVERLVPSSSAFSSLNMAEKVPSFKTGGTLWFTDLTTADTTYILPLLTAITFIIMVEEGMEGNPIAGTMKKFSRIIAFLSIPILMGVEKALFCYWLTSNLFTLGRPDVRKLLNLSDAVTSSSTGQPKPPSPIPFSFEQPKDQSVIGHKDPPMVNKEASGPQASHEEIDGDGEKEKLPSFESIVNGEDEDDQRRSKQCNIRYPAGRSAKAYKECGTGLGSYFQNRIPRGTGPPCPARRQTRSVRSRTGRENPIDISMST
ncbi:hypothetical protein F2Q69_00028458 [Brassica cretica]|uniref:Uncharacterized protein n=1 Tax=Brassica cretica TaxID=69181 RepID=A0A8S9S7I2_BRACR|nr:hypothetical protein F2Q69_00028458 [Brassica cretica]